MEGEGGGGGSTNESPFVTCIDAGCYSNLL